MSFSAIFPGASAMVDVTASAPGMLNAWVDWNQDGDWSDLGEQIFMDEPLIAGLNGGLSYSVPLAAASGSTFARFRVSTATGLAPTGPASDGEVEDWQVMVNMPSADLAIFKTDSRTLVLPGASLTYLVLVSNEGSSAVLGATVEDIFPDELGSCEWICNGDQGTCTAGPVLGDLIDTVDLASGGELTYEVTCQVDAAGQGLLVNVATVALPAGWEDSNPSNNTSVDVTEIALPVFADGFETGDVSRWSGSF